MEIVTFLEKLTGYDPLRGLYNRDTVSY